jgi:MarR family 2-MHQ and catechol resistance regulon transcriptional repressor
MENTIIKECKRNYYTSLQKHARTFIRDYDESAAEVVFNILHVFNHLRENLGTALQREGISIVGFNVLGILNYSKEKGLPLNILSRLLIVSRANITGVIDSLVRNGLVARFNNKADRRVKIAKITKKGEKKLHFFLPRHHRRVRNILGALSKREKQLLSNLLVKLLGGKKPAPKSGSASKG